MLTREKQSTTHESCDPSAQANVGMVGGGGEGVIADNGRQAPGYGSSLRR